MSRRRRSGGSEALNPWPGYVDALSTLLMVIIFVLLVFVLAQAFLSVAITGKDRALDQLHHHVAELTDMLALERGRSTALHSQLTDAAAQLAAGKAALEAQARTAAARVASDDQARIAAMAQLDDEKKLAESAQAQLAPMSRQLAELRDQLAQLSAALSLSEQADKAKDVQIANLGSRLNAALASKVEELQRYRSEFFGRLREVLANRPGVQVVGDRFVFQSEVLFPPGSAELSPAGADEMHALAGTLKDVAADIPPGLSWILRVDGHADRLPITRGAFPSNWELSSQRAINVVKLLIDQGIPANHLAATGFADFQPVDGADTPDAYAKNRRIELRLTDR